MPRVKSKKKKSKKEVQDGDGEGRRHLGHQIHAGLMAAVSL